MTSDELAGTLVFNLQDVINGLHQELQWANLYGGPINSSNEQAIIMNRVPACGSTWRGRVLMSLHIEQNKRPSLKTENIEDMEFRE